MKWNPAPPEAAAAFAAATSKVDGLEHRKMFGYDAVFANDRMVGGLHEVGMVLRLSDADRERFVAEHGALPFVVMGRTMREYVVVPAALHDDAKALERWVRRGLAYTSSMPSEEKPGASGGKKIGKKAATPSKPAAAKKGAPKAAQTKATAKARPAPPKAKRAPAAAKPAPPKPTVKKMRPKVAPGRQH